MTAAMPLPCGAQRAPHALDPLFHPRSIAVVGASSDPRKIGGRPIAYMLRSGFSHPRVKAVLPSLNPGETRLILKK